MLPVKCWNIARKIPIVKGLYDKRVYCNLFHLYPSPLLIAQEPPQDTINLQFSRHIQGMLTILNKLPNPYSM